MQYILFVNLFGDINTDTFLSKFEQNKRIFELFYILFGTSSTLNSRSNTIYALKSQAKAVLIQVLVLYRSSGTLKLLATLNEAGAPPFLQGSRALQK